MTADGINSIFTPTTPAKLTFVEREAINHKLVNALRTPGKQIVVYGHSGSGKTTLLVNKLHQLYDAHITSRCMKGTTFEKLLFDAFDQLTPFYISERNKMTRRSISADLGAEFLGIKDQLKFTREDSDQVRSQRALPPQFTAQALGRFLGAARCCWVIEDFHKVESSEKASISQMMKIFMDTADQYGMLKIVAVGAVATAQQVVSYDPEMRNRVAEIYVPLMTNEELQAIVDKGEKLLNVKVPSSIKSAIVHYSNGLASVCHHLCLNLCTAAGVCERRDTTLEFGNDDFKNAVTTYLDEASDTLKIAFARAIKRKKRENYDNAMIVLRALSKCPQEGAVDSEISKKIVAPYPAGNLARYLLQLQTEERGAVVRYDDGLGTYAFADPMFRAFCLAHFKDEAPFDVLEDLERSDLAVEQISVDWLKHPGAANRNPSSLGTSGSGQ